MLSLIASNAYGVAAVTLDASMLAQLGYNNKTTDVNIGDFAITDIDPNAFKGYKNLTYFRVQPSGLAKIDLSVFNDSVNLQNILFINNPSLTQITNSKKVVFPSMQSLLLSGCPLNNLDSNVINSLPNLGSLEINNYNNLQLSPLKPNQLSPLKKLGILYISVINQTSLTKDHFTGLNSLGALLFTNSHIKTIEVHSLLAMPNLTYVDFSNNDITAFEYLQIPPKVNQLRLSGNKMNYFMLSRTMGFVELLLLDNNLFRSFKSMDFTFLSNLTYLDLSNNPHAYPNEIAGHMKPLVNLYYIGLSNLSILSIDSNFFKQNIKLNSIYLSKNKISNISYNAFINLKQLSSLDLSYNQICFLDNRTFSGLNLWSLYLQSNKLTKIFTRTFYNLTSLYYLDLSYNLISEIESSAFSGSVYYSHTKLEYNQISKIWPRAFDNFKTYSLTLNNNQITELDNSTFNGLIVNELNLSNNNISKIGSGTFNNTSDIQYLYLSNNLLTKLNNGIFVGLNNLRSIEIRNNMISTIEAGSFDGLTNLQWIDLTYNKISLIEAGALNNLISLQSINFYNNNITQLDNSTFAGCNNLQAIYLYYNPNLQTNNLQSLCPTVAVNCRVFF